MKREYTIFTCNLDDVKKLLSKYEKKAVSFGTPFSYKFSQSYIKSIPITRIDDYTGVAMIVSEVPCEVTDVVIEAADIKLNGWSVAAKIEHYENRNIVFNFGDDPILNKWKTAKPYCDHCKTLRQRNVTYVCRHENEEKQIGSNCLKDYTGIDPAVAVWWAQAWFPDVPETIYEKNVDTVCGKSRVYEVKELIAHAVDSITTHGYRKSHEPGATRVDVYERLHSDDDPTPEAEEKAQEIIDWLKENKSKFKYSSLEETCCSLIELEYVKPHHIGYLAYVPIAYDKWIEQQAKLRLREQINALSNYIGEVGQRVTLPVLSCRCLTSWDNGYGSCTSIYKFVTTDNNVLVWKTSKGCGDVTKVKQITGTVKTHQEYNGVKQTELTRCKLEWEGRRRRYD